MQCERSKPIACRFRHIALEAEIGKTGFDFANLLIVTSVSYQILMCLVYLMQSIAHYCPLELQNNYVMVAM